MCLKEILETLYWIFKTRFRSIRICLIIILILNSIMVNAQEADKKGFILLQGVVMDANSLDPLPNVHYILNEKYASLTDSDGEFSLYVSETDTIRFSYIGYSDLIFIPGDTLKGKMFTAGIFMESDTLSVGEVLVVPRIPNLRTGLLTESTDVSTEERIARNNITASVHEGLTTESQLGDPETYYYLIKRKQIQEAYERGAIPSDRMIGINFLSIPAAIIYYAKGPPERPEPPKPRIPQKEINRMKQIYKNNLEKK